MKIVKADTWYQLFYSNCDYRMIDRVDNNNYTNSYSQKYVKKPKQEETPAFLLNYDEKGVIWDRENKKEEKVKETLKNNNYSKKIQDKGSDNQILDNVKAVENTKSQLSEMINQIFSGVKHIFKGLLDFIWYGNANKENDKEENITDKSAGNTEYLNANQLNKENELINNRKNENDFADKTNSANSISAKSKEELIKESIARKDTGEVVRILTDNYSKIPARNSNLLTQYNKYGKIVSVDGADINKILKGTKGIKM